MTPGPRRIETAVKALARAVPVLEVSRFALIGCANTLIDFCVFLVLARALQLPLVAANLCAWAVAFTFSFLANGRWTFGLSWVRLLRPGYYAGLAAASLLSVVATTSVLVISAAHVPLVLAKLLSISVGFVINYALAKRAAIR